MYRYYIIYIMYNYICRSIRRIFIHLKKWKTEARSSAVRNQGDAFPSAIVTSLSDASLQLLAQQNSEASMTG